MGGESCKPTWPLELVNALTIGEAERRSMSLYKYFQPTVKLPDPEGHLKKDICSSTIQIVNDKVRTELEKKPRGSRNPYLKLTPAQKATVGKRATEHGVTAAIRYFSPRFPDLELKETTVRRLKNNYTSELKRKRQCEVTEVTELPSKKTLHHICFSQQMQYNQSRNQQTVPIQSSE